MAKVKMISTNKMDKVVKTLGNMIEETTIVPFEIGEDEEKEQIEVVVIKALPFDKFAQLVTDIVYQCFQQEGDNRVYYACKKQFVFKASVIQAYTNIKTDINTAKLYHLVNCEPLYREIVSHIDNNQFANLMQSVEEQIEFEKKTLITNYEEKFNKAIEEFNVVTKKLSFVKDVDMEQLTKVMSKIEQLSPNEIVEVLKKD